MTHTAVHCIIVQCVDRLQVGTRDVISRLCQVVHIPSLGCTPDTRHIMGATAFVKDGDLVRVSAADHSSFENISETDEP